jgi:hypothetical protein
MTSDDLYDAFRSDVVDLAKPYLWTDEEVFRYMGDAHRMFSRLTNGVSDFTSEACTATIVAGEAEAEIHPSILRVMTATTVSDKRPLKVLNESDLNTLLNLDYGQQRQLIADDTPGDVVYMLIGRQRGKVRWIKVPEHNDTVQMTVYRTPLVIADSAGKEITDVHEDHHIHLLDWMKHLAYKKKDAETLDPKASEEGKESFHAYCEFVKKEWDRYKHKTRVVQYGGV